MRFSKVPNVSSGRTWSICQNVSSWLTALTCKGNVTSSKIVLTGILLGDSEEEVPNAAKIAKMGSKNNINNQRNFILRKANIRFCVKI